MPLWLSAISDQVGDVGDRRAARLGITKSSRSFTRVARRGDRGQRLSGRPLRSQESSQTRHEFVRALLMRRMPCVEQFEPSVADFTR